jgi:adenine-specific DNA-methyltransferase
MSQINKKTKLGQFYSKNPIIRQTIQSLIQNDGPIMEPSVGQGDLLVGINDRELIMFDVETDIDEFNGYPVHKMDFFDEPASYPGVKTIIGNPPFVKFKLLDDDLKAKMNLYGYKSKSNLYYLFIHRCIEHLRWGGELIFIAPKEFMFNVGAANLRRTMYEFGQITHFIDCGRTKLFADADVPSLCIFRYEKTITSELKTNYWNTIESYVNNDTSIVRELVLVDDQFTFSEVEITSTVSDFFDVRVGIVNGKEKFYLTDRAADGNYVTRFRTGENEYRNYYFIDHITNILDLPDDVREYFLNHKEQLINRKIKSFNEDNWWKYGAVRNKNAMTSDTNRIYVPEKTRVANPFFVGSPNEMYCGSLLGLFPNKPDINLEKAVIFFNSETFKSRLETFFIKTTNKYTFTPSILGKIPLYLSEIQ